MSEIYQPTKVLITVKTYPHPSRGHLELVCTAGITEAGEWVRLYPIDYRYRPRHQQFEKYQWVEVELAPRGSGNDDRKESRKPNMDSLRILTPPLSTKNEWCERREIIDRLPVYTKIQLEQQYAIDKTSLGIVRPTRVLEIKVEQTERDWKPDWQQVINQMTLFGPQPKPLTKIPYKFSYVFECEDSEKPHNAMIEDWELGRLFLREVERRGSEERAIDSVINNFITKMADPSRDLRFFMGTVFPYNTWVVIGTFYPPKIKQPQQTQLGLGL